VSVSPRPWRFEKAEEWDDMGRIVDADGETVCSFGDATQYYPTQGDPPDEDNLAFLLAAVNRDPE
jgi:hypothetical protein